MMFRISLKVLRRNLGKEFLSDYKILDQKFRESIEADRGDLAIGKKQLRLGLRVNILAYCEGEPAGFVRLDLRTQPPLIGDLYVEPEFRGEEAILEETPWLENEKGYKIWQYLIKASFVIARRAGYKEVGSYIHNKSGERLRQWRLVQMPKWESEVGKVNRPSKLLEAIKQIQRAGAEVTIEVRNDPFFAGGRKYRIIEEHQTGQGGWWWSTELSPFADLPEGVYKYKKVVTEKGEFYEKLC